MKRLFTLLSEMTKKISTAAIAGILCVVAACNDDASVSPTDGGTKTVKQDTVPVAPQPADTTVVTPDSPEDLPPGFSQSDLDLIASLKAMIPLDVLSGFEEKYAAWESSWSRPEIAASSHIRGYAESEEYEDLLQYCKRYGKASWPLFMDKLGEGDVFVGNLLEDLTYTGTERFESTLIAKYLVDIKPGV
ncbi:MAG: hypothetical protein LBP25_03855, partial [Tannerellaceae bacterium]|nr:hypothetical protein [Tannerellaceae bacterium]